MKKKQIFLNIFFVLLLAGLIVALVFVIKNLQIANNKTTSLFNIYSPFLETNHERYTTEYVQNLIEETYNSYTLRKSCIISIIAISISLLLSFLALVYINKNLFPKLTNKIENKVASIQQKSKENKQAKQQLAKQQKTENIQKQLEDLQNQLNDLQKE